MRLPFCSTVCVRVRGEGSGRGSCLSGAILEQAERGQHFSPILNVEYTMSSHIRNAHSICVSVKVSRLVFDTQYL